MDNKDEATFNEFKEIFNRYLDPENLSDQEFLLRNNMIQFIKSACIESLLVY
ncbi:MAG: hypothetical protein SCH66_11310 [Methanolobus sp.]|nr:hypothetical protein [Methanolobus sp.]